MRQCLVLVNASALLIRFSFREFICSCPVAIDGIMVRQVNRGGHRVPMDGTEGRTPTTTKINSERQVCYDRYGPNGTKPKNLATAREVDLEDPVRHVIGTQIEELRNMILGAPGQRLDQALTNTAEFRGKGAGAACQASGAYDEGPGETVPGANINPGGAKRCRRWATGAVTAAVTSRVCSTTTLDHAQSVTEWYHDPA